MTPKTETLYRINPASGADETIFKNFLVNSVIDPVTVHVGEFYIKGYDVIKEDGRDVSFIRYEKVTHVLPDQFRDDTKNLELILQVGELIHDKIELQKKVEELRPELEEVKKTWVHPLQYQMVAEANDGLLKRVSSLEKELEEAKKGGVVWSRDPFKENETIDVWVNAGLKNIQIYYKGLSALIPIPKPPQPRTIDEQAEEAWEKSFAEKVDYKESLKEKNKAIFIEGFKAAKEGERECHQ